KAAAFVLFTSLVLDDVAVFNQVADGIIEDFFCVCRYYMQMDIIGKVGEHPAFLFIHAGEEQGQVLIRRNHQFAVYFPVHRMIDGYIIYHRTVIEDDLQFLFHLFKIMLTGNRAFEGLPRRTAGRCTYPLLVETMGCPSAFNIEISLTMICLDTSYCLANFTPLIESPVFLRSSNISALLFFAVVIIPPPVVSGPYGRQANQSHPLSYFLK